MDVLIKGMEMPSKCEDCPCFYPKYNECNAVVGRWVDGKGTPPSDCPLIPVPPHGRLIDADALNKLINQSYPMTDRVDVHNGYAIVQEMMKQLPTIIEAEVDDGDS